ncbi:MAG: 2Fe-2S iron-sulfur cluster-binding protein [Pseudomonadota bacterium]|nr:2Fe-2S iron-sulfur cluster-binding protein [Pseudomonadota bacterium]
MNRLHKLRILKVRKDTPEALIVALEVPASLRRSFGFKHGQFLTLKAEIDGEDIRRPYSICSQAHPVPCSLEVGIKKVADGVFSSWAHKVLSIGDELEVLPPDGSFTSVLKPDRSQYYCCVAIGSGITPIISVIRTVLDEEPLSKILLIYGNRRTATAMFLEEINALKNRYMGRFQIYHIFSQERGISDLLSGRIKGQSVIKIVEKTFQTLVEVEFFLCGPAEASDEIFDSLIRSGVPELSIHQELFGQRLQDSPREIQLSLSKRDSSLVTLRYGGRTYEVQFQKRHKNILEAGLEQGLDLPYSCKAGACTTCRGVLVEGDVHMGSHHVLDKASISAGYILTCQSRPDSERIIIDLDHKK